MDADRVLVKAAQAGDADAIDTLVRRYQVRMFNERDLDLEAHDTDTHGYTEINVAAVALVGRRFCPRTRRLHRQRISCADPARDHGVLEPVLPRGRRAVHVRLIAEQGDRIGQFDAAFPAGHATASAALQRLNREQVSVRAMNEIEAWGPSDHCRLMIEVPDNARVAVPKKSRATRCIQPARGVRVIKNRDATGS